MGRSLTEQLVRWPVDLATEVIMVPSTLRSLRETVSVLPATIHELQAQIDTTTAVVNRAVPQIERVAEQIGDNIDGAVEAAAAIDGRIEPLQQSLDRVLPDGLRLVEVVDGKVQTIGAVVSELSEALMVALRLIPGVRKSSRAADQLRRGSPG